MLNNMNYSKVYRPRGDNFPSRYCFYDCISTYARSIGHDFELCFLSSWEFKYIYDPNKDISKNLLLSTDYLKDLKKHHGIKIQFFYKEKDKRSLLIDMISQNAFVILRIDAYYIPWDLSYKKEHGPHFVISRGIDPISNELMVTDPYYDQAYISFGVLDEAVEWIEGILTAECCASQNLYSAEALIEILNKRFELVDGKNSFNMIEDFANDIDDLINQQFRLHNSSLIDIRSDKLKYILIDIYEKRQDFCVLLDFCFRTLKLAENTDAKYFKNKILDIINRWNIIQLMYVKAVISNNLSLTESIKDKILYLADAELQLTEELIDC